MAQIDHVNMHLCVCVQSPKAGAINKCTDVITSSQKGSPQWDGVEGNTFLPLKHMRSPARVLVAVSMWEDEKKKRQHRNAHVHREQKQNLKDMMRTHAHTHTHRVNLFPRLRSKIRGNTPLNWTQCSVKFAVCLKDNFFIQWALRQFHPPFTAYLCQTLFVC